jgi:hypothetical protein
VDIGTWLRELGLECYEHAFRENEIDAGILPKLTTDDLKDIGVTAVGHRREPLEAIAVLAEPAPQAVPSPFRVVVQSINYRWLGFRDLWTGVSHLDLSPDCADGGRARRGKRRAPEEVRRASCISLGISPRVGSRERSSCRREFRDRAGKGALRSSSPP